VIAANSWKMTKSDFFWLNVWLYNRMKINKRMCQSKVDILAVEEVSVAMVFPLAVVVPVKPLMQASAALVTSVLEGAEAAAFGSAVMVLAVFKAAVNMWMDMNKVLPISRANE
jgi:hypothetical protein